MIAATAAPYLENILGLRVRRRRHDGQPPLQRKTWVLLRPGDAECKDSDQYSRVFWRENF
jgi:hypothetical protein